MDEHIRWGSGSIMKRLSLSAFVIGGSLLAIGVTALAADAPLLPHRSQLIERGRYLVKLGGCNDCHSAGYAESGGRLPEAQWLTGVPLGWKGPWGTTYASNLRTYFSSMSPDQWVKTARTFKARPPMPWFTLNEMTTADLRAMHAFVSSLGPAGGPVPAYVPPGGVATTPVVSFPEPEGK